MMERFIYIVVLCYCVSSVLITQSSAAVGAACTTNPTTVCVVSSQEVCETNVCVCKTGFINKAGTCTAFDCSSGGTCKNSGTCGASQAKTCTCVTGWKGDDCGRATLGVGCSNAAGCTAANNETCDKGGKCACKPGFADNSGTCKVPDNAAGKKAMAAVTMMMAVLTNIIIQMF